MLRVIILILLSPVLLSGQVDFETSLLPIVKINTLGDTIPLEDKTMASLDIIYNGNGVENNVGQDGNEYSGFCGIELRGESSISFEKKNYSIELWDENGDDIDAAFLNFPEEEDFILYGPYSDKSLINNVFAMHLARSLGQYASRTRLVEVVINDDYKGLYVLMEKIKRDKNRIDIANLKTEDNSGDQLTGGYIIRIDHSDGESGWHSDYQKFRGEDSIFYQYYYPEEDKITPEQESYIQAYVKEFEDAIATDSFRNEKGKHYTKYINIGSFIDNFFINEITKNVDAYWLSSYFHKDRTSKTGKLTAGPIWDYNLSMGNASYCNTWNPWGWMYYDCSGESPFWWDRFLNSFTFTTVMRCRWESLRTSTLATDSLLQYIDDTVLEIGPAADRNFQRWPILGTYVWPNSDTTAAYQSHEEAIQFIKRWLPKRLEWMDANVPGVAANCGLFEDPNFEIEGGGTATVDQDHTVLSIYPNPVNKSVFIAAPEPIVEVILYNQLGEKVITQKVASLLKTKIDLGHIGLGGQYQLSVKTRRKVYTQALIIAR